MHLYCCHWSPRCHSHHCCQISPSMLMLQSGYNCHQGHCPWECFSTTYQLGFSPFQKQSTMEGVFPHSIFSYLVGPPSVPPSHGRRSTGIAQLSCGPDRAFISGPWGLIFGTPVSKHMGFSGPEGCDEDKGRMRKAKHPKLKTDDQLG